jgi:hypothetical protein
MIAKGGPARTFLGYRKGDPVYGILAKNGLFRVRTETKWISYRDFELESRIKHFSRSEVVEYCRTRCQTKQGKTENRRLENEDKAPKSRSPSGSNTSTESKQIRPAVFSDNKDKLSANYEVRKLFHGSPRPTQESTELRKSENVQRLNWVWARQEALRDRAGIVDAKIHGQTKYARKEKGPFAGYYTSEGQMLCIDDEEFVEYRVLLRPT